MNKNSLQSAAEQLHSLCDEYTKYQRLKPSEKNISHIKAFLSKSLSKAAAEKPISPMAKFLRHPLAVFAKNTEIVDAAVIISELIHVILSSKEERFRIDTETLHKEDEHFLSKKKLLARVRSVINNISEELNEDTKPHSSFFHRRKKQALQKTNNSFVDIFLKCHIPVKDWFFEELEKLLLKKKPFSEADIEKFIKKAQKVSLLVFSEKNLSLLSLLTNKFLWQATFSQKSYAASLHTWQLLKVLLKDFLNETAHKEWIKIGCLLFLQEEIFRALQRLPAMLRSDVSGKVQVTMSALIQCYKGLLENFFSQSPLHLEQKREILDTLKQLETSLERTSYIANTKYVKPTEARKISPCDILSHAWQGSVKNDVLTQALRSIQAFLALYNDAVNIVEMASYSSTENEALGFIMNGACIAGFSKAAGISGIQGCDEKKTIIPVVYSTNLQAAATELKKLLRAHLLDNSIEQEHFPRKIMQILKEELCS